MINYANIPNPEPIEFLDPRETAALERVAKIWMFISQFHPRSQATIFVFVVLFQQLLASPDAGLRFILPVQVRDIQQGTKNDADGTGLNGVRVSLPW